MDKKAKYKKFCQAEKNIPIFSQPWWLDIVCDNNWEIILVERNNQIIVTNMRLQLESILEVENITKEVNSPEGVLTILKDVSLTINSGDVTSIVGPSGSGKTTLLAIMAGLDLPTTGTINLLGEEITGMNE